MTKVVHCWQKHYDVYIGRPTKFGNPFHVGIDGTQEEVVHMYRAWIMSRPKLLRAVRTELKGKILGCWCKPKACHGDVLKAIADDEE